MKYLFALIEDETRYLITQVTDTKLIHDASRLFHKGKEVMGKKPATLITDGLYAYHTAYNKEFFTVSTPRTEHVNTIKLSGNMNNNKMERLNGELRDRQKVMRNIKKKSTATRTGYQLFHNYFREHQGLKGRTPAQACGIEIKGDNKWLTLIQNASKK
jgi:putative transposase